MEVEQSIPEAPVEHEQEEATEEGKSSSLWYFYRLSLIVSDLLMGTKKRK